VRNLATIRVIKEIRPIPDADKIEVAVVDGWECVVTKEEKYKVGDKIIYVEIDSVMPERPEYAFLKERKYRVRTIKLRKQISQGLILPLKTLDYYYDTLGIADEVKEGDDVTEILGVKKYDPEGDKEQKLLEQKTTQSKNKVVRYLSRFNWFQQTFKFLQPRRYSWPKFIKKTDEERIQNLSKQLEYWMDLVFIATEKLDGQSATYFLVKNPHKFLWWGEKYIFGVCSRNYQLKENNSNYWKIARQFNIKSVLKSFIADDEFIVLQGEIIGEGIQGNKYKIGGLDFYAFNLIHPTYKANQSELHWLESQGIKTVPVVYSYFRLFPTIQETVKMAIGKSILYDGQREGIVVRNYEKNISFKIINPEFLLKYEE
jgi:hypothetical protein